MSIARRLRAWVSDLDSDMATVRAKTLGSTRSGGTPMRPKPGEVRVFSAMTDGETMPADERAANEANDARADEAARGGRAPTTQPRS